MGETALQTQDRITLDANLAAMETLCPESAQQLRQAEPPGSVQAIQARDGAPTYAWSDGTGRLCWLGRTSMPTVSSAALVDAFEAGSGNVLLGGFGQGGEACLLLQRLAPHQAVMVVDENAWAVALALSLHDFAEDLRRGRLLVFVGAGAWDALRDFLLSHDGYLVPERVLAWPWFDAAMISQVTDRLSEINATVGRDRFERHHRAQPPPRRKPASLALVSNVPEAGVRRWADQLEAGAAALGWICRRFTLDGPATVHPYAVERALSEARPALLVLLGIGPGSLQYPLPSAPCFVVCIHRQLLAADWLQRLPPSTTLGVQTEAQKAQAIELGVEPSRVVRLPPAALPGLDGASAAPARGILVVGDGADLSPEALGLHLASHRQLWQVAGELIRQSCDTYFDDQAGRILKAAQEQLGIKLASDEVRQGLVARIRQVLGPAMVRRLCCLALMEAGIPFDLYGTGWECDPVLSEFHRGPWPEPAQVRAVLADHGAIVSVEPSGCVRPALLDGIAAGLAGIVRAHPADETHEGLAAILDVNRHVHRFDSRAGLVEILTQFRENPGSFRDRATMAARHVNEKHTWADRLDLIIRASVAQ